MNTTNQSESNPMETDYRTTVNKFYRRMKDLDKRKKFPFDIIIDHSWRFKDGYVLMSKCSITEMIVELSESNMQTEN